MRVMPPRSFSQKVRPSRRERHWQPAMPDEREQCGAMPGRGGRRHDQGYWQHGHHLFRHIRQRFRKLPFLRFRSVFIETGGTYVADFNESIAVTGMPYIDDNSPRQNSPLRISIALAARYVDDDVANGSHVQRLIKRTPNQGMWSDPGDTARCSLPSGVRQPWRGPRVR